MSLTANITIFIVTTIIVLAILIAIYYFYQIKNGKTLTPSQINTALTVLVIAGIIAFVMWLYLIYMMFSDDVPTTTPYPMMHHSDVHHIVSTSPAAPSPHLAQQHLYAQPPPVAAAVPLQKPAVISQPVFMSATNATYSPDSYSSFPQHAAVVQPVYAAQPTIVTSRQMPTSFARNERVVNGVLTSQ